jgi:hypothetical protein
MDLYAVGHRCQIFCIPALGVEIQTYLFFITSADMSEGSCWATSRLNRFFTGYVYVPTQSMGKRKKTF